MDLARLTKDMDLARRRGVKQGVPALRKLELLAEQKRTAELTSDFDDYDLDEPKGTASGRVSLHAAGLPGSALVELVHAEAQCADQCACGPSIRAR